MDGVKPAESADLFLSSQLAFLPKNSPLLSQQKQPSSFTQLLQKNSQNTKPKTDAKPGEHSAAAHLEPHHSKPRSSSANDSQKSSRDRTAHAAEKKPKAHSPDHTHSDDQTGSTPSTVQHSTSATVKTPGKETDTKQTSAAEKTPSDAASATVQDPPAPATVQRSARFSNRSRIRPLQQPFKIRPLRQMLRKQPRHKTPPRQPFKIRLR